MADDLNPIPPLRNAVAVVEIKCGGFPRGDELDRARRVAIVIARNDDHFAIGSQTLQQLARRSGGSLAMHEVAQNQQTFRLVNLDQFHQPLLDGSHPPERKQMAGGSVTEFVTEMKIGHRQPAFGPMKEREPAIEHHIFSDERLIGGEFFHDRRNAREENNVLPVAASTDKQALSPDMTPLLRFTALGLASLLTIGCACQSPRKSTAGTHAVGHRHHAVRTTAYTHTERGGRRNAVGTPLCGTKVISAAADWSRWPFGTTFRVVGTNEVFRIDDYGGALIGTDTIDLYKTNRLAMNQWGVRAVDIDILQWGSAEQSRKILKPRARNRSVRAMMAALDKQG
jgi:3D (Asp-Asp-Asp) domain-containing protein